jgi:hypothetical protein
LSLSYSPIISLWIRYMMKFTSKGLENVSKVPSRRGGSRIFAGSGPTPTNDVMSPKILRRRVETYQKNAIAVKLNKIWEVLQLPVHEIAASRGVRTPGSSRPLDPCPSRSPQTIGRFRTCAKTITNTSSLCGYVRQNMTSSRVISFRQVRDVPNEQLRRYVGIFRTLQILYHLII